MIKTIKTNSEAEITVKKSRFIANIFSVETEEEAKKKISEIKSKYYDAKHVCHAYIVSEINENGKEFQIEKFSDNGEPSGTAGAPMLEILKKQGLSNVVVTVTRYFGGILLGTGGLVRAYSDSLQAVLEKCEYKEIEIGKEYQIVIEYSDQKNLAHLCGNLGIEINENEFGEKIKVTLKATDEQIKMLNAKAINFTTFQVVAETGYKFI